MVAALLLGMILHAGLSSASLSVPAQHMLADLNATRARAGLAPLRLDPRLTVAAERHGIDMAEHHYFDHRSLDGEDPFARIRAVSGTFEWAGENIAMSRDETTAYEALLESPDHRANILQPHYSRVGLAAVEEPDGEMLFVQDFTN